MCYWLASMGKNIRTTVDSEIIRSIMNEHSQRDVLVPIVSLLVRVQFQNKFESTIGPFNNTNSMRVLRLAS